MIVYDELRLKPLFKPFFEASGVKHANHFRSIPVMLLFETRARKALPLDFFYKDPACDPTDDKIIVFDTHTTTRYLNWLCKHYPNKRIILWFWNPVEHIGKFNKLNPRIERWCYSEEDALQYGMYHNTQFFFDSLAKEASQYTNTVHNGEQKALFIGREKGRAEQMKRLQEELTEAGIVADYRIIPLPKKKPRSLYEKLIPYRQIIEAVKDSQILIDLYADPTAGLSLRAMEALFYNKKLLTNRAIMKKEDFYDSRNIYILGEEKRTIKEFLTEPYTPPDPAVKDRYLLSSWLERFEIKELLDDKERQTRSELL